MMPLLATVGPSPLWYLTRASGMVALILLTASVLLGIASTARWQARGKPRFLTQGLHRNISLLVLIVLALHIVTAELDTFAPVGWLSVFIPFASPYRPIWLGLGTAAFDLLVALCLTSVMRARIGYRTWKAIHWAAYACWPLALVHGLGTGTDAHLGIVQVVTGACVLSVLAALLWRLGVGWPSHLGRRIVAGGLGATATVVITGWAMAGPWRAGWASRAGTPSSLLASAATGARSASTGTGGTSSSAGTGTSSSGQSVTQTFTAQVRGTISQTNPDSQGQETVTLDLVLSGGYTGKLMVVLRGQADASGVVMTTSSITLVPSGAGGTLRGNVTALNGNLIQGTVASATQGSLQIDLQVQIDQASGAVTGTVTGGPAGSLSSTPSESGSQ
ncbi:MAG: ferric reductase-like transmembrane domain-containing protein [Acidimicrobiales bacterium]